MLNRYAFIVRYKQPFVDWINTTDPDKHNSVTVENANNETAVYLIKDDTEDDLKTWLKENYNYLFEELLNEWNSKRSVWPKDRSLKKLKEWCSFEFHSIVIDKARTEFKEEDLG